MADEPQSTEPEQTEPNPATEYQPGPSVITVYDSEGREHFAAPTSKKIVDGLADGTFTTEPPTTSEPGDGQQQSTEEPTDGAESGSAGDNLEPGSVDGADGSGDGAPEAGSTRGRRRAGQA